LAGLICFHDTIGPTVELTHDTGSLRNTLTPTNQCNAEDGHNTALYLTTHQALTWLIDNPNPGLRQELQTKRKMVLVLTDGRDTQGGVSPGDVRDKALQNHIPIYTVGVGTGAWDTTILQGLEAEFDDAEWLARTSEAKFLPLTSVDEQNALYQFFDGVVTQRSQYQLRYQTQANAGSTIKLCVKVNALNGAGQPIEDDDCSDTSGRLKLPEIRLTNPVAGQNIDLAATSSIELRAEVTFPDGIQRKLDKVEYFVCGNSVGTAIEPPYTLLWTPPSDLKNNCTFVAVAHDSALKKENESERINVNIIPVPTATPTPTTTPVPTATPTFQEKTKTFIITNPLGLFLLPFVIGLAVMLFFTRRQISTGVQVVATGTTTLMKGLTQRLGGPPAPAHAKLVVNGGPGRGSEYRIPMTAQFVRVGRDIRSSDFQINDPSVSSLHFSIIQAASPYPNQPPTFQIRDESSVNQTVLNGIPLQPQQPYPLSFGSTIQAGNTTMVFQQIGGATQRLSQPTQYQP